MYLLIVSGMSGAGKTQALKRLEDMGFFCVDNLPCEMLTGFLQLCQKAATPVERAAVVIDSRESKLGNDLTNALHALDAANVRYDIVFLDCQNDILERRFNETRRPHPVSDNIKAGIRRERELLAPFQHRAKYVIDTTKLRPMELMRKLEEIINDNTDDPFMLLIESFGYKRGVPMEADYIFDVRFTDNPFYEPELKPLSGLDAPVREFVLRDPDFAYLLDLVESMLDKLIPRYKEQGKHRLMIAFGCTGGRHRSVCAAQVLYERMKGRYRTHILHRDMADEQQSIQNR